MKSYSQFGQDIYCYEHFFKTYQHGVFVEIGADDGIDKSNTLLFENLGWKGLCVEASPARFELLKKNRKCSCENVAVWDKKEKAQFLDILGWGKGLSGIIENYHERHIGRIGKEICHPDNQGYRILEVECISINDLLGIYGLYHVDFCSIDTEGGELEILESLDMERFKCDVVCVENNYGSSHIQKHMKLKGYDLVINIEVDEVYKRIHQR